MKILNITLINDLKGVIEYIHQSNSKNNDNKDKPDIIKNPLDNESSNVQKRHKLSSNDTFRKDDEFRMKNQSFRKK